MCDDKNIEFIECCVYCGSEQNDKIMCCDECHFESVLFVDGESVDE